VSDNATVRDFSSVLNFKTLKDRKADLTEHDVIMTRRSQNFDCSGHQSSRYEGGERETSEVVERQPPPAPGEDDRGTTRRGAQLETGNRSQLRVDTRRKDDMKVHQTQRRRQRSLLRKMKVEYFNKASDDGDETKSLLEKRMEFMPPSRSNM